MAAQPRTIFDRAFRARLQRAREDAGLTQKQMADKLGVTAEAYAKYENRSTLPLYLLSQAADVLRLPVWFLLTGRLEIDLPTPQLDDQAPTTDPAPVRPFRKAR